jgi:Ca2+-binding EF-hand superfamily protein
LKEVFRERTVDPAVLFQDVLQGADLNDLARRFDAGNNQIDIRRFLELFERPAPRERANVSPMIASIKSELTSKKLLLKTALGRLARGDSDDVSPSVLLVALQRCGIALIAEDLNALQESYPGVRGSINWRKLCADVDPTLADDSPATASPPPSPSQSRTLLPPSHIPAMRKVAECVRQLRLQVRDDFRRADRLRSGYVSYSDFTQILSPLIARFSPEETEALFEAYQNLPARELDYLSFCTAVGTLHERERETGASIWQARAMFRWISSRTRARIAA